MGYATLLDEINKRVNEILLDKVVERAKAYHIKKEWRTCECRYCKTKRDATVCVGQMIGDVSDVELVKPGQKVVINPNTFSVEYEYEPWEAVRENKDRIRKALRKKWRTKLKIMMD